jgi:hypothetical protein
MEAHSDPRAALGARVSMLIQQLGRLETRLGAAPAPDVPDPRIVLRFRTLVEEHRARARRLAEDVDRGVPLPECWAALRQVQDAALPLFREGLRFIQGAMARTSGLDEGLCRVADALLHDLSARAVLHWDGFTVLDEGEFFGELAKIIRLRFPDVSIWDLPVAVHEFGHFVAQELRAQRGDGTYRYPVQALLAREAPGSPAWWALQEHFADAFATFAAGPAYAAACILLRFDPMRSWEPPGPGSRHPAPGWRVATILHVLREMDRAEGGLLRPYGPFVERLARAWESSVASTRDGNPAPPPARPAAAGPAADVEQLYEILRAGLPNARYDGWQRAASLAADLASEADLGGLGRAARSSRIADVLNAAWLWRLEGPRQPGEVIRVGGRALALCRLLAA